MSTVKIKTEPTTTATTTATAVDVKVKLEPSLSTVDIKLEQHTSDIDTKVELDSDDDSDIKSENDDDDEDTDQNQFTITPKKHRKFSCDHLGCGRNFISSSSLRMHQHEHRLQADINILGKTYFLVRQSLIDRWPCPIPDCTSTFKTVSGTNSHIRTNHDSIVKQQQQQQQLPGQIAGHNYHFLGVVGFYVNGVRCSYHKTTGVLVCHECRLVPECLLTHLQQKHGFDEKSIDSSVLPEIAVTASADPNINQHTSIPHLASALSRPYQQQHQDIIQGWLCVTSDCGHCGYTVNNRKVHKRRTHQSEQFNTVPALVLRLTLSRTQACYFLIVRIDQASGAVTTSSNRIYRHRLDYSHNGLNFQNENGDDIDRNETTDASNQEQQWKCERSNCGSLFNSSSKLSIHRREHKLDTVLTVQGKTFSLTRQSSNDRWACPISDCETTCKSIYTARVHIKRFHSTVTKQKRANSEDDSNANQQVIKRKLYDMYYLNVDDFYISGKRCGYHKMTGLFICHECKLVPECLLTHLQQKHEYEEKSINNAFLPDSAVKAGADPGINQHTSNTHLASAISQPYQQHHPDIVQGWLCTVSNCGHCCSTKDTRNQHQHKVHRDRLQSTVPALVLRLLYAKTKTTSFLITRLDRVTNSVKPSNSPNQFDNEEEENGDELVSSDYSD